ncbi:MAG: LptA/OstA family protein [Nitrospirota bacterium]|nr:LptA/OstA family protein [Nitrospirota bacterium]
MSKLLLIVSLSFFMLFLGISYAEDLKPAQKTKTVESNKASGTSRARVKGPVTVTSETLTADNQAHTALFEKNVIAKTTDMTMYADWMLVYYTDPGGDITKIESKGNVKVHKEDKVMTSQAATYYADSPERIVFTGSPRAFDGQNVVSGTKITYYVDDDRSFVEGNSKVIMKNKQDK